MRGDTKPIWERMPSAPSGRSVFLLLITVFLVVGMVAPAAGAVTDVLNTGGVAEANTAPHPYIQDDGFTKSRHPMSEGTSHEAVSGINDDQGEWIPGSESIYTVNRTADFEDGDNVNPYSYEPGQIEDSSYTALENASDSTTWINATDWTKGGANSSGLTLSNATAEDGVPGVQFDTGSSFASGDTAHGNFTVAVDTDESKRVLMLGMDVTSLEAATNVTVRVVDESEDYKEVTLNQSEDAPSGNNFANSTGDSKVFQIKLNKLSTTGGGSFDNIEKVQVIIDDGDADVTITWLDLRKKAKNVLGEQWATTDDNGNDDDSDGDYDEKQTIYNATGSVSVHSMDTLDPEYDDAVINDLSYPVHIDLPSTAVEGEEDDFVVYWEDADDYPNFDHVLNYTVRLEAISYIDASYGNNLDLMLVQKWPESRYISLDVEEGASGSNLSDISGSSQLSSLGSQGDELSDAIKLDDSVSSGTEYLVHFEMTFTDAERNNDIEAGGGDTGTAEGGAPPPEDSGGFWSDPVNWVWSGLVGIVGILGLRRFGIIGGG